ncbi:hypothetical protein ElyMa_004696200 [Elysia marginata]|uniref:PP1-binding domain-containing protein n=1 Tax=Elysia marginata TaxID=1093978 RepID=A0AAV4I7T6_9GAST|nr:hypothetical protein ElyMa_004696200 [Elysia marginata]
MSGKQAPRLDSQSHAAKTTPSKARSVLSLSQVYPGSGSKGRSRQSLRTPQQHVPLKVGDREKNRRASKSFVLLDQSDMDTPRAHIEAFLGADKTVDRVDSSSRNTSQTKRKKSPLAVTPEITGASVLKVPRLRELAATSSVGRPRGSSPASKLTPRSNILNLLKTGDEQTPAERTIIVSERRSSPEKQNLTSVKNAGQRVSVSPINVSSAGGDSRHFRSQGSAGKATRRRSFHLSFSQHDGVENSSQDLASVQHSGQRVSVSPINTSDHRVEEDKSRPKPRASRRSFHLNAHQAEVTDDQTDNLSVASETEAGGPVTESDSHSEKFENKNKSGSDEEKSKDIPLARKAADQVTGTLELGVEHTSLVVGERTDRQTQDMSWTAGPANLSLSLPRKSSVSRHIVSVSREVSSVEPRDLSEDAEGVPGVVAGLIVEAGDGNRTETSHEGLVEHSQLKSARVSNTEENQTANHAVQRNAINGDEHSSRETTIEDKGNLAEPHNNADTSERTGLDYFRADRQEKVVGNVELRPEVDSEDERPQNERSNVDDNIAPAMADPASVYDLSEGSSSSKVEDSNISRGRNSKQKLNSERKKTPGSSAKRGSVAVATTSLGGPSSSKRKRLEFPEHSSAGTPGLRSPDQEVMQHDQPRSSTPINRSRRFFNSTKIQRSVTDYFQGDQDLMTLTASPAMTPKIKNLFSDISPIRAPLTSLGAGKATADGDKGGDEDDQYSSEEPANKFTSTSKRIDRTNLENAATSQSSDGELPS